MHQLIVAIQQYYHGLVLPVSSPCVVNFFAIHLSGERLGEETPGVISLLRAQPPRYEWRLYSGRRILWDESRVDEVATNLPGELMVFNLANENMNTVQPWEQCSCHLVTANECQDQDQLLVLNESLIHSPFVA